MTDWTIISREECDRIWGRFRKDFSFHPSVDPKDWPAIETSMPTFKIDIAHFWGDKYSEAKWASLIKKGIDCFTKISNPQDEIIVLDWQHECFFVNPRNISVAEMIGNDEAADLVPSFVPDGDYYVFLTKDFSNIWFGHPWEKTITLVGENLINAFRADT